MGRRLAVGVITLLLVCIPTLQAHADADHDAKQDKHLANVKLGGTKTLKNGPMKAKSGWGSGCQATGGEQSLIYPVAPHVKVDTFKLHVRWCVRHHQITSYSVWPTDDPWAIWIHWEYGGIINHVVNSYNDRIYARFEASYKMCVSWLFSICREHRPWISVTVYNRNKAPVIKGGWAS